MKTLITEKECGFAADGLAGAGGAVTRRGFLMEAALITGAMMIKPARALPGTAYAGGSWKRSVCNLTDYICPPAAAARIREAISRADLYLNVPSNDFHSSFSATYVINARVYPEQTYGGRYFEVERLPFYDSRNPCRREKDLNALEINRILDSGEREYYGGVVSPCSERRQLAYTCEWETYRKTAEYYREDPDAWQPVYTRNFTDGKKSYLGFAVKPRTNAQGQPLKQLLISPDSI